jgi:CDP-diglyceride synthetase
MAFFGITAVVNKESYFVAFAILCLIIAAIATSEAIWLYRQTLRETKASEARGSFIFTVVASLISLASIALIFDSVIIMLLVIAAFCYDIFAIVFGRLMKGRFFTSKPFPQVSKNKTWEGIIGGIASSIILSFAYLAIFTSILSDSTIWSHYPNIFICLTGGAVAAYGDYANSYFKRLANVKDSGWIFPGHGGCLDRFMSLFCVTVIYLTQFSLCWLLSLFFAA